MATIHLHGNIQRIGYSEHPKGVECERTPYVSITLNVGEDGGTSTSVTLFLTSSENVSDVASAFVGVHHFFDMMKSRKRTATP